MAWLQWQSAWKYTWRRMWGIPAALTHFALNQAISFFIWLLDTGMYGEKPHQHASQDAWKPYGTNALRYAPHLEHQHRDLSLLPGTFLPLAGISVSLQSLQDVKIPFIPSFDIRFWLHQDFSVEGIRVVLFFGALLHGAVGRTATLILFLNELAPS